MKWPSHGSNPRYLYEATKLSTPDQILDFSANINPLGPPKSLQQHWGDMLKHITTYPDPMAKQLKKALANGEGISENNVLVGNGGAEVIALLGRFLAGKRVLIMQPTFSEYEIACKVNGCEIVYHTLNDSDNLESLYKKMEQVDALFICNPNNPTGTILPKEMIDHIVAKGASVSCYVILDEAFYDFVRNYETNVNLLAQYSNVILLRSLTKMFAIPGIRLGYLLAAESVVQRLTKIQPHWSVNSIALSAGELLLKENGFIVETQHYIEKERERLFQFFEKFSFTYTASHVNFYLLRDDCLEDQEPLLLYLLEKGIVPRHTYNFLLLNGRWLRFAIKTSEENARLMEVLKEWKNIQH